MDVGRKMNEEEKERIEKVKRLLTFYRQNKKMYITEYWNGYTQALTDVLDLIDND